MPIIKRLADSCLLVTTDAGTTLLDPGFFAWDDDSVDLASIGDVQRVLITHEHGDHVKPEFVRWLVDRGSDVGVFANQAVADLLAPHEIEVAIDEIPGVAFEDVLHELTPAGDTPPNRSFTVEDVLTHPGDSFQPTVTAPVLALPLLTPFGSMMRAFEFARRLAPQQIVPIHDFYLSESGRSWVTGMAKRVLAPDIDVVSLDWGDSYSI